MPDITIATWNTGNRKHQGTRDDFRGILGQAAIVGTQEASDPGEGVLYAEAKSRGWRTITGDGYGSKRVSVHLDPRRVDLIDVIAVELYGKVWQGPGAGGTHVGPKWLLGAVIDVDGTRVAYGNTHPPASQYRKRRRDLARQQIGLAVKHLEQHDADVYVLTGDMNARPDAPSLKPLRDAGYRCIALPTHGVRPIDHIWVKGAGVGVRKRWTRKTRSDHRAMLATLSLPARKPKPPVETKDPPVADPRLARPFWRGRTNVDALTIACIEHAERLCGRTFVVTQGSYQSSVAASAGTHDGGGVVDLRWSTVGDDGVLALRQAGMPAWHRTPAQGNWPHHVHAAVIGHPALSPAAARQITAYMAGRNGLANNGRDDGPRLNPIPRPVWPPNTEEDPLMAENISKENLAAIAEVVAKEVWAARIEGMNGVNYRASMLLAQTHQRSGDTRALAKEVAAVEPLIDEDVLARALAKVAAKAGE